MFTKTRKNAPSDEVAKNAQLLIKAGYINKEMAGVYTYLPLGLKVLNNIIQIIRDEMNAIGGQEMLMTSLQKQEVWEASGRWSDDVIDVWFKTKLANGQEIGLATTHEEALTNLMKQYISSYKDLPTYPYQFQTKFRNELRSKSGIMRGREFIMKDLYSFSKDEDEFEMFYEESKKAYKKVFERVGLGDDTYMTFADGGSFSEFSHEFQTLTDSGEDTIYLSREKNVAVNKEVYRDDVLEKLGLKKDELEEVRAAEVGNIFPLGTKFSDAFNLKYTDENGDQKPVVMGCYGIGPGRTMGVVVEKYADNNGLIWPETIAPASLHIVRIGSDEDTLKTADRIYEELTESGVEVIYDDRDTQPGTMLADADLIGIPKRLVVSSKSLAAGGVEVKLRVEKESKIIDVNTFITEQKK